MDTSLLITLGGILLSFVLVSALIMKFIRKVPPEEAMVVYGAFTNNKRYVSGGGVVVIPFLQDTQTINISIMTLPIQIRNALSQNGVRINVELNSTVKISSEHSMLSKAFECYGGKDKDAIKHDIERALYGQVREIVADTDLESLTSEDQMAIFQSKVFEKCKLKLQEVGVEIKILNIENFDDDDGFFDAMKAKAIAEKKSKEEIDQAEAEKNSRIKKSEFEQTAVIAEESSRLKIQEEKLNTEKSIRIKEEQTRKESDAVQKETLIAQEKNATEVAIERARKEEAYKIEQTKQQKVLEIAKQEIEIAKEEKKLIAETARAKTREQVEYADIVVPAEQKAKAIAAEAKGNADAAIEDARGLTGTIKAKADAEAHEIKVRGSAEAETIELVSKAKAKGILEQIMALNSASPAVLQFMMMEKLIPLLPEIISAATKHMASIDNITLIGGSGDGKSGNPLTQFMEMGPLSLMKGFETAKAVGWNVDKFADKLGITLPTAMKEDIQEILDKNGISKVDSEELNDSEIKKENSIQLETIVEENTSNIVIEDTTSKETSDSEDTTK